MKKRDFTIIEVGNIDCPNIGTLSNVSNNTEFNAKLRESLESHFDCNLVNFDQNTFTLEIENKAITPFNIIIELDLEVQETTLYEIQIQETWIY